MGAGNAFRQLGATVGIAVFFVDAGKGALAILIARAANIPQVAILFTGATAVVGHNWPVFIGFRGGSGGEHYYWCLVSFGNSANANHSWPSCIDPV
jgi:glycerol-3-phosphate acyltransferase PlsY